MHKNINVLKYILFAFILLTTIGWTSSVRAENSDKSKKSLPEKYCIYKGEFNYNFDDSLITYSINLRYDKNSDGTTASLTKQTTNYEHTFNRAGMNIISIVRESISTINLNADSSCPSLGIKISDSGTSQGEILVKNSSEGSDWNRVLNPSTEILTGDDGVKSLECPLTTIQCEYDSNASSCVTNNAKLTKNNDGSITVIVPTSKGSALTCSTSSGSTCQSIAQKFVNNSGNLQCPSPKLYIAVNPIEGDDHSYLLTAVQARAEMKNGNLTPDDISDGAVSQSIDKDGNIVLPDLSPKPFTCDNLPQALVDDINEILNIVYIMVPIIIIGLGSLDFAKAVISQDDDAMKKASSSFVKRLIAGVIIFFLPIIVKILLNATGNQDFLCGIGVILK